MICPSCDTPNRDDAKFCKRCGHAFQTPEPAVAETAPVNQPAAATQGNSAEDISQAPTQIITPQQMLAFHAHRWQQGATGEAPPTPLPDFEQTAGDTSEMPTLLSPSPEPAPALQDEQKQDSAGIADMPTVAVNNTAEHEEMEAPSTPPPPAAQAEDVETVMPETAAPEVRAEGRAAPEEAPPLADPQPPAAEPEPAAVPQNQAESEGAPQEAQPPAEQGQAQDHPDFPALAEAALLNGRYEVTHAISTDGGEEHTYEVVDHQGYQHCWNCGSAQNAEGDEFCIDCGAELLNASYILHEYPATGVANVDANVITGSIMNTFVEHGHTYVVEQIHTSEDAFPNGVHLIAACDSDAGNVRRSDPNEDSTLVLMLQRVHESLAEPAGVFIVADGLGGHDNGQEASRLAINIIAERMVRELLGSSLASEKAGQNRTRAEEDALVALLQGTIEDANAAICQVNQHDKTDMGSTITGFMIVGDYAYILNVGDSRTYMVRGGQIYQLTNDHSLVGQLVAGGLIQPDDVYTHPQRSQIFRSLGDKLNVQIDIFKQQLHPGDILLSCSDGLWEMVRNPQLESILNNAPDPQLACTQLLEAANANGGEDNVSAVVVFVR